MEEPFRLKICEGGLFQQSKYLLFLIKMPLVHAGTGTSISSPAFRRRKNGGPKGKKSALGGADRIDTAFLSYRIEENAISVAMLPDAPPPAHGSDVGDEKNLGSHFQIRRYGTAFFRSKPDGSGLSPTTPATPDTFKK